jgi:hypothetical protein
MSFVLRCQRLDPDTIGPGSEEPRGPRRRRAEEMESAWSARHMGGENCVRRTALPSSNSGSILGNAVHVRSVSTARLSPHISLSFISRWERHSSLGRRARLLQEFLAPRETGLVSRKKADRAVPLLLRFCCPGFACPGPSSSCIMPDAEPWCLTGSTMLN